MKAVVFHKPKDFRVQDWDDPKIKDNCDAIVRITSTAICGSDLHMYNGTFPQMRPMVMVHEFMGVVEEVGGKVKNLKKGDCSGLRMRSCGYYGTEICLAPE